MQFVYITISQFLHNLHTFWHSINLTPEAVKLSQHLYHRRNTVTILPLCWLYSSNN